jgi:ABC-type cobalamin/Fe3+-siderophores transport system ATPase subunit
MIKSITLTGFESLTGSLDKFAQVNIIVGKNGAGKSAILRLLNQPPGQRSSIIQYSDFTLVVLS